MSKIEIPFHIDKEAEFRFALVLESRSVEAHSLMDSEDNKEKLKSEMVRLEGDGIHLELKIKELVTKWKEKHK